MITKKDKVNAWALVIATIVLCVTLLFTGCGAKAFVEEPEFQRYLAVVGDGGSYEYHYLVHKPTGVVYLQVGSSIIMMRDVDGNPLTWDQIQLNKELKDGR